MTTPDPREATRERMNGDYEAPILREPDTNRPVPVWTGEDESPAL